MTQSMYTEIGIKDHMPIAFDGTLSHTFRSAPKFSVGEEVTLGC